jgi:hypothetical protein
MLPGHDPWGTPSWLRRRSSHPCCGTTATGHWAWCRSVGATRRAGARNGPAAAGVGAQRKLRTSCARLARLRHTECPTCWRSPREPAQRPARARLARAFRRRARSADRAGTRGLRDPAERGTAHGHRAAAAGPGHARERSAGHGGRGVAGGTRRQRRAGAPARRPRRRPAALGRGPVRSGGLRLVDGPPHRRVRVRQLARHTPVCGAGACRGCCSVARRGRGGRRGRLPHR